MKKMMLTIGLLTLVGSVCAMEDAVTPEAATEVTVDAPVASVVAEPATLAVVTAPAKKQCTLGQLFKNPTTKKVALAVTTGLAVEETSKRYFGFEQKNAALFGAGTAAVMLVFPKVNSCVKGLFSKKATVSTIDEIELTEATK
ncbi:hypothetical protein CVU75_02920 [Candidatus Dependentiae bacterium HGW-Dependentiae-1]|nr:MAG: hypothetical protein CVU75_02920 [Candidatus Dependentiae bacterium HGW-Dependentiae-1]